MSNAMIVNAAPVTRAISPARVVAGGRRLPAATPTAAPVASSRKLSIVSTAVMGRSGSSRTVVAAAFNFKNPFGGNSDEEEDAEEEAGGDSDTVEGNPFLSKSSAPARSVDEDSSSSSAPELPKLPKLPGNPFASFGAKPPADDEEDEEEYAEEFEAPTKSGNPFGNPFASFGGMNQTIDQTVDLDYGDDEDDLESEPSKGGFGGFALPSFPKKDPPAPPAQKKEPEREKKTLGNWERTIREGLKDSDVPIWTLDPESVRGASLRPVKLRAGDFLVVGRDKGPGVDYVAKVNCVSGVHCQFEMDGQKLFVTDLGKFILMLVWAIILTSCFVSQDRQTVRTSRVARFARTSGLACTTAIAFG